MKLEVCFSQSNGLKYLDGKLGPLIRSIEAKAQCNKIVVTDIKKNSLNLCYNLQKSTGPIAQTKVHQTDNTKCSPHYA